MRMRPPPAWPLLRLQARGEIPLAPNRLDRSQCHRMVCSWFNLFRWFPGASADQDWPAGRNRLAEKQKSRREINEPIVSAAEQERQRKQADLEAQRRLLLRRRETQKQFDEAAQKPSNELETRFGALFTQLDASKTGTISSAQFEAGLQSWGYKFSDVTISTILSSFASGSTMSKAQFLAFMKYFTDGRQRFRSFDADNSNSIDQKELAKLLADYKFTERAIADLIALFDSKDRQTLEFADFMALLISLRDLEHHITVPTAFSTSSW
jgi:Ca2+-binding EF-hand superfamily protein